MQEEKASNDISLGSQYVQVRKTIPIQYVSKFQQREVRRGSYICRIETKKIDQINRKWSKMCPRIQVHSVVKTDHP